MVCTAIVRKTGHVTKYLPEIDNKLRLIAQMEFEYNETGTTLFSWLLDAVVSVYVMQEWRVRSVLNLWLGRLSQDSDQTCWPRITQSSASWQTIMGNCQRSWTAHAQQTMQQY